jgi:hypothetical protein
MLSNVRYEGTLLAATVTVAAERARATRTAPCGSMSEPAVGSLASAGRSVDGHCQWNGHGHGTSLTRSRRSALSVSSGPRPDRDSAHPRSRCSRLGQRTRTGHCGHSDAPPGPKRGSAGAEVPRQPGTWRLGCTSAQTHGRARGAQLGAAAQPGRPPAGRLPVTRRWASGGSLAGGLLCTGAVTVPAVATATVTAAARPASPATAKSSLALSHQNDATDGGSRARLRR